LDRRTFKEVVPKLSRVAFLWNPANPGSAPNLREAEAAALTNQRRQIAELAAKLLRRADEVIP
jgi:hypothetical protein